jgi:hypothetical protein
MTRILYLKFEVNTLRNKVIVKRRKIGTRNLEIVSVAIEPEFSK